MTTVQMQDTQRGAVLVVSLLMLLVMTVVGVVGIGTATLEERMAANNRDREVAFQAAEYALRDGERYVQTTTVDEDDFSDDCTGGLCDSNCGADDVCAKESGYPVVWKDTTLNVWATGTRHKIYTYTDNNVREKPKYIVEFIGYAPSPGWDPQTDPEPGPGDPQMFRITALGTGATPDARVMLQSTYQKNP
jgi:type IV pilus assembly protein PilX